MNTFRKSWRNAARRLSKLSWKRALRAVTLHDILCGMKFDYNQYFERRREVCGGELLVKGTR